jgi:hypothetical protein
MDQTRVTRLGEFSPIVSLFTMGGVPKNTDWMSYILGDFFKNSSGHPGQNFPE